MDDPDVEGGGQQKPYNDPRNNQHNPVRQLLGPAQTETTPQGKPAAAAARKH